MTPFAVLFYSVYGIMLFILAMLVPATLIDNESKKTDKIFAIALFLLFFCAWPIFTSVEFAKFLGYIIIELAK